MALSETPTARAKSATDPNCCMIRRSLVPNSSSTTVVDIYLLQWNIIPSVGLQKMTISLTHPLLPLMSVFEHALTQKPGTSQALTLRPTPKDNALPAQKVGGDMQERRVISILEVQSA